MIELKRMSTEDKNKSLEDIAAQGMEQIKAQKYRTILDQHQLKSKVFMSVAFQGKQVSIFIEKELSKNFRC